MVEAEKVGSISSGEVYHTVGTLDQQIKVFHEVGIAPVAIRGGKTILVKKSPLMNPDMARVVVATHKAGKYLEIPGVYDSFSQIAKDQLGMEPEDRTALELSGEGNFDIGVDIDEAKFLFGKQRRPYFERFVTSGTIPLENLSTDSKVGAINHLWFYDPRDGSYLCCGDGCLGGGNDAFGVLRAGGASAKNLGYSLTEIVNANSEAILYVLDKKGLSGIVDAVKEPLLIELSKRLRNNQ
ncbi:hypothetical protein J4408_04055 [Candidatus Pacearchaeota archaeon]|nr:hypothetical protein [Candidatus Pacearchaeota archaeon]